MSQEAKRKRAPNFSTRDRSLLVDIVLSKYKDTIENFRTDSVTAKEKAEAWKSIAADFNPVASVSRTAEGLKVLYENIKRSAKKTAAGDKVKRYKTGGGKSDEELDTVGEKVLAVLGPKITPLPNPFDSDAVYNDEAILLSGSIFELNEDDSIGGCEDSEHVPLKMEEVKPHNQLVPYSKEVQSCSSASATDTPKTRNGAFNFREWNKCWTSRRRPAIKGSLMEKKVMATASVGDLALSKKKYYERMLEMAEEEHEAKMKLLEAKTRFYSAKSPINLNLN